MADLELTEDHEEATEVHPDAGELDLIVGVRAPGEVRKTHHVSAHSPFPEGSHIMWHARICSKNAVHLKHELRL